MSYGATRYLYNNAITDISMITVGSQAGGVVSGVEKSRGTGAAVMIAVGAFSGSQNLDYIAQIDSTAAGSQVGQATFRWKTSASVGWEATGVTTSSSFQLLNYGVSVAWVHSDTPPDFTLDDTFQFFATARYGTANLIDLNPNNLYRSGVTFPMVIDLGAETAITAFALYNHNLTTANSTLTLQGNATDSWGSPSYSQALTITNPLIYYLSQAYRYWRIVPTDSVETYWQAGGIYLGTYIQPSCPPSWGSSDVFGYTTVNNDNPAGIYEEKAYARQHQFALNYSFLSNTDFDMLATMQAALVNTTTTGRVSPLYVHLFYDESDTFWNMNWKNIKTLTQKFRRYQQNADITLDLAERVVTRT